MAYPCTTIDVVGTDHRADKFLHQIIFLIGAAGGGNATDIIRTEIVFDSGQLRCDIIIRFVPGSRNEFTFFPDQRSTKTIGMIVEGKRKSPFETSMTLVDFGVIWCLDRLHFVIVDGHFEIAAYAAIRAYRSDFFIHRNRLGFKHIGNR